MRETLVHVFLLGLVVLAHLRAFGRLPWIEVVAQSWLVGSVFVGGAALFVFDLGGRVESVVFSIRMLNAAAVLSILGRCRLDPGFSIRSSVPIPRIGPLAPGYLAAILGAIVSADFALRTNERAITLGDEANVWATRAKIVYAFDGMTEPALECVRDHPQVASPGYPWLNPALQVLAHGCEGAPLDALTRVPIQLFGIVLPLLLAGALARIRRSWLSALLVLAIICSKEYRTNVGDAGSDFMVAGFALGMASSLVRYSAIPSTDGNRTFFALVAGIHGAGLVFSKNEGVLWFGAILVAFLVTKSKTIPSRIRDGLWISVPAVVVIVENQLRNRLYGIPADRQRARELLFTDGGLGFEAWLARSHEILATFVREGSIAFERTHGLVAAALLLGFLAIRSEFRAARPLVLAAWLAFIGFFVVYLVSVHDIAGHMKWSAGRLLLQMMPICALALAMFSTAWREARLPDAWRSTE